MRRDLLQRLGQASARSRQVDHRARFVMRELRKTVGPHRYRLATGETIWLRHHGIDTFVLEEIFGNAVYDPPAAVADRLRQGPVQIVDLGANIGLSMLLLLRHAPEASVIAFEPDPDSAALLERTVADNGWISRVRIETACAGTREGTVQFSASAGPLSQVVDAQSAGADVLSRRLVDVLPLLAAAQLVKMDIEGAEWEILEDARFVASPPEAIVLEYHDRPWLTDAPLDIVRRVLETAGMSIEIREQRSTATGACGVVWGWR